MLDAENAKHDKKTSPTAEDARKASALEHAEKRCPHDKTAGQRQARNDIAVTAKADHVSAKLQGWAIVDNQTDNDWNDVQLSLVSGRPLSFIQDLYHSLYIHRPVIQPDNYASLYPQTYSGGMSRKCSRLGHESSADFANALRIFP